MQRLSVNLLSNTLELLREVDSLTKSNRQNLALYSQFFSVSTDTMIEMASDCKWLSIDGECSVLTDRGEKIVQNRSDGQIQDSIRLMLEDYITIEKPIWRGRIPYGRAEAVIYMTKDEQACFKEAGLLSEHPSEAIVEWWDRLSAIIRNENQETNLITGRKGEKLTLQYEEGRTKTLPYWKSIESNKLGYDIISQVSGEDKSRLLIEVKASTEPLEHALFYISKNEWSIASASRNYLFYLWLINPGGNRLAIISTNKISEHIPINQQEGEWEDVSIPFKRFADDFVDVVM